MGAEADGPHAIVVLPKNRFEAALAWCRQRPREVAAAVLVGLTALTGVLPPATTAGADTVASARSEDPAQAAAAGREAGLYPVTPLPQPAAGPIPLGKGMWLHKLNRAEGGDVGRIVTQAKNAGLTHIYVRLGSSKSGFYAQGDLDRLLPVAHAAGLKVVGWDFPYLFDPFADAARARDQIWYATPTGHRIDAFSADIETPAEGTKLNAQSIEAYTAAVRQAIPEGYPLIATVPRPSPKRWFPFEALHGFDAIAPMVYWGNRDPGTDVAGAIANLAFLNKPILPVGQAYDMAQDGAPAIARGAPSKAAIEKFIRTATAHGALGVSFWVWDTATPDHWAAVSEAGQLNVAAATAPEPKPEDVAYLQRVLTGLGHPTPVDGQVGPATTAAITELQRQQGLQPTGRLDSDTVRSLLEPTQVPSR